MALTAVTTSYGHAIHTSFIAKTLHMLKWSVSTPNFREPPQMNPPYVQMTPPNRNNKFEKWECPPE